MKTRLDGAVWDRVAAENKDRLDRLWARYMRAKSETAQQEAIRKFSEVINSLGL